MPELTGQIVALDYGRKRIGVASAHPTLRVATPVGVIRPTQPNVASAVEATLAFLNNQLPHTLVVGLPLELSGKAGIMAQEARAFGDLLGQSLGLPCIYTDERFTSKVADTHLRTQGFRRRERDARSDSGAACQMLADYLLRPPCPTE